MLLVAFPAQMFNSTLQAHYAEVMGWFGFLRRLRLPGRKPSSAEYTLRACTAAG